MTDQGSKQRSSSASATVAPPVASEDADPQSSAAPAASTPRRNQWTTVGREIVVTILDVRAASTVTASSGWSADGTWLLIDLDAESVTTGRLLKGATLTIDALEFRASERMDSLFSTNLVPGIPRRGTIAFELPDAMVTGTSPSQATPASIRSSS